MEPTLKQGSIKLIKKWNLKIEHNDIVVIKKNNRIIIKRIVAIPYDTVEIDDYLYINNERYDDLIIQDGGIASNEIILNENEYFVLGDNRQNSIDSRFHEIGIIKKEEIIGKLLYFK